MGTLTTPIAMPQMVFQMQYMVKMGDAPMRQTITPATAIPILNAIPAFLMFSMGMMKDMMSSPKIKQLSMNAIDHALPENH